MQVFYNKPKQGPKRKPKKNKPNLTLQLTEVRRGKETFSTFVCRSTRCQARSKNTGLCLAMCMCVCVSLCVVCVCVTFSVLLLGSGSSKMSRFNM